MTAMPIRALALRMAVPAVALGVFCGFAALWATGLHDAYAKLLGLFGFGPFRFPFLDAQAILAAADCRRLGIDVYLSNPCDVLGRPHVYSPLWLTLVPGSVGIAQTVPIGLAIDLLFIALLPLAIRPRSWRQVPVYLLAVMSPMTVYALERGNNDLIVFAIGLAAAVVSSMPPRWRAGSYALLLFGGLLKYYPAAALLLVARENLRRAVTIVLLCLAALGLFILAYRHDLTAALANVPDGSYFEIGFSARDLPFGIAELTRGSLPPALTAAVFAAPLLWLAGRRTLRGARMLAEAGVDWHEPEVEAAVLGSLILMACFVAGANVGYRGVWFLLVLPGLLRLRHTALGPAARNWASRLILVALLSMWQDCYARLFYRAHRLLAGDFVGVPAEATSWMLRELCWWWLMAGLAALALAWLQAMPAPRQARLLVSRLLPRGRPPPLADAAP